MVLDVSGSQLQHQALHGLPKPVWDYEARTEQEWEARELVLERLNCANVKSYNSKSSAFCFLGSAATLLRHEISSQPVEAYCGCLCMLRIDLDAKPIHAPGTYSSSGAKTSYQSSSSSDSLEASISHSPRASKYSRHSGSSLYSVPSKIPENCQLASDSPTRLTRILTHCPLIIERCHNLELDVLLALLNLEPSLTRSPGLYDRVLDI